MSSARAAAGRADAAPGGGPGQPHRDGRRRAPALEAARGALMALHAAAGLATGASCQDAVRLLRAAEGLCRAAVATLAATPSPTTSSSPAGAPAAPRPRRRRGRRGGGRAAAERDDCEQGTAVEDDLATGAGAVPATGARPAAWSAAGSGAAATGATAGSSSTGDLVKRRRCRSGTSLDDEWADEVKRRRPSGAAAGSSGGSSGAAGHYPLWGGRSRGAPTGAARHYPRGVAGPGGGGGCSGPVAEVTGM